MTPSHLADPDPAALTLHRLFNHFPVGLYHVRGYDERVQVGTLRSPQFRTRYLPSRRKYSIQRVFRSEEVGKINATLGSYLHTHLIVNDRLSIYAEDYKSMSSHLFARVLLHPAS